MHATVMYGAGDVRVETVPDAHLIESTDAVVRVTRAAICGSDLWQRPVAVQEHAAEPDGPSHGPPVHRRRRVRRFGRADAEAGATGRRAISDLRRHVRVLPRRAPGVVRSRRTLW